MSDAETKRDGVCAIGPEISPGTHATAMALNDGRIVIGEMRPYEEGKPLQPGDMVVDTVPHDHNCGRADVRMVYEAEAEHHDGPARVSTRAYREGWERTFGKGAN